ncbi:flavin monoamine oxidase family protein [Alterisphingorhabdus coralli]|uniref:Tryptophan 2-monooxygenase n=1 Tax=Alterisphingorhabdus coralli TaxID=3071408 RepID=A0AA97F9N0_9SPHN|nr:FAD-dependent oxidoreductase [Parasphingorhabdus sp. SCSIO 66989]WOE76706.1 FAD-dependent oxidoreductase [Parasphingorhabdus sp. SCSIO 66989]
MIDSRADKKRGFGERKLLGYLRTNWSRDPYSYGSYSHFAKGTDRTLVAPLAKPLVDRLFFAGEAMHPHYNSTVHAALESGQKVAALIKDAGYAHIAVIGAGVSGLAAAQLLTETGAAVTIYEARERIGGRVWTNHDLGPPLDLGASWIHGMEGNPLTDLADNKGIRRVQNDKSLTIRGGDGRRISNLSAPDWLTTVTDVQNSLGADPERLNLALYEKGDGHAGPDVIFPGGYAAILSALTGDYAVKLSTPVEAIAYGQKGVTIRDAGQAKEHFDAAIVTVPLGVLKRGMIAFDPALPAEKRDAIDAMAMGTLDKLYLLFDEAFWDDSTFITTPENGLPRGQFNDWMTFHRYLDAPVILAFNGGPAALALAEDSDEALLEKALATLERAYPSDK